VTTGGKSAGWRAAICSPQLSSPQDHDDALDVPRAYRIHDPRTGLEVGKGRLPDQVSTAFNSATSGEPRVVLFAAAAQ
jgi:hypothetical protein